MKKLRCQFDISKDWVKPSLVFAYGIIDKEKFEDVLSDVFNKGLIDEFGEDLEGLGSEVENKISAILDIKNLVSNLCSIYDDAKKVMELRPGYLSNMQLKYLELLKDYNVKIDNFFNPILSKYSLPVVLSPAEKEAADEELGVKDLAILDNSMEGSLEVQQQNDLSDDNILESSIMGTDSRSIVATNDINLNTEVTSDNDITFKLFKGKVTAKDDFIKRFITDIVSRAVISVDPKKPKVFTNNADIDRSIKQYKDDLFFEVFGEPLYIGDDEMKPMRSDYIDKMNSKIMEYNSMNDGEGLKAKDIDGMIMNRHNGNYDKFLAFCMLKNFDSLIKLYGNRMVNVKENFDGMPDILGDDSAKYYFKKDRTATSVFSNSDFTDAMSKVSGVAKMFIESTPIISDNGIEIKNKYLRTDRVFNITTKIGKYVSRLNHFESFRKTLEDIIKKEQGIKGDYKYIDSLYLSKDEIAVVKSLYVKFFKNERALKTLGDFGKSVSTNYKNLSFAEVLRHEYTSGNMPMNLVDIIGSTFAKTIALKYDEVSFDFETKENRIKNLEDNISRRQSSLLSQSISASFFTANERVSGRLLSRYNIDVDLTTKVVKMKLPSGKIINHNVVDGKSYNEKGEEFDFSSIPAPNVVSLENWLNPDIYSDYIYILSAFQNLTSQQLKGLDSALINTFKASVDKDRDNKHLSYLQSLISNAAFIHGLVKQEIPDGVKDASTDLISALNKIDEIEKDEIYDKRNRIFKIQFNKFSKAALGLLANSLSIVNGDKTKSVIKNSEGNSLPVYGPVNLINDVKSLIDLVKMNRVKFDKDVPLANNLFLENPELLNGISVRTNYENMGKTKSSAKLSEGETVVVDILYGYGDNKVTSGNPCFQPTVFSDKTKHSGVEINGNVNVSFFDPVSNRHINKKYKDMNANDFKTLHYQTQHMYYKALEKSMLKTYNEVFVGHDPVTSYLAKTKVLSASGIVSYDGEKLKIGKVPKEFVGATITKEIATIESMFKAKQSYEKKGKFNNITQASLYVMSTNEKEFLSLAKKNTRRPIVVELLYTKGSAGVEINSLLVDRIKMYSPESHVDNEAYESMMEKAKETFAEKLERGFSVDYINDMGNENGLVNAIYDDFKISKTDWINSYTKRVVPFKRESGKVVLNPFIEQYFWEHNVVSENFQNLTVGTIFGHKGAGEAKKTIAMLKRMVAHQATFHPYYNGSINGVNHITKTVYVKDPKALLYNVMGMVKDDQEITDGGSAVSMLETILKNNSLLDQAVAIHKKDIGMTIDGYYNAAGLMKHASHALSNEDIRRTRGSEYDLKKLVEKMYKGEPISVETGKMYHWNIDGIPINLDITRDFNGNFIGDISSLNPMFKDGLYYLNDKGHVVKVLRIEPSTILNKGDESVVVSTNLYTVSTQNMTTGEGDSINNVPINNLNDLWNIFGAENSVTLDDNGKFSAGGFKFSYSDASHYALAEFVNRVGFWRNEESFKKLFEQTANRLSNSGINVKTMTDLRKLTDRLSTVNHNTTFDKNVDEVNQSAIFQPLKVNHIGMINFASGQKVGAKNLNDSNILNNNEDFWASETNNLHTGVQLDYEHETDESHVTEMTQIISALIFNGDTKDIALGVYGAIGEYVKKQMENFINSTNEGTLDGGRKSWLQLADVIIKKQGSDKGSLQGMILSAVEQSLKADKELISKIEQARSAVAKGTNPKLVDELTQELANHMKSAFNVPMSDSSLFSTAFSTLSNHFTAEMIRRKFEGGGLVISGLSGFMQLQELPVVSYGSETLVISKYVPTSGESYKFWEYNMTRTKYYKNSIAAGMTHDDVILSILRQKTPASNVLIGDTVIVENADGTSKSYTLGSYTDYLEFKEEVSPSTIVTVDKTAKRMMRPLNWTWESGGIKTNLYDQIQVKRAYLFDDFYGRISTLNSALNKKTPEGMSLFEQNNERAELIKTAGKLVKFTQKYKSYLTGLGFDDLLSFDSVEQVIAGLRPIDNVKYIKQVLKEGIRKETRNIDEGFMSVNDDIADMIVNNKELFATSFPEAAEILPQLEGLSKEDVISTLNNMGFRFKISNMVQHPMEIGLPNMNASKFGLPNDIDISEVTEKTFEDQEISRVKSKIKHYDMYLRDVNGKHLYVFVKNSKNANNLIKNNLFKEAKNETITIDNKTFLTNPVTGAILYEIGNNRFGHISDNGMIHDAVIVNSMEDLNLLVNNTVQEEKKYEGLMVNYAVKDPRLIKLATQYKLSTNLSDDERILFETVDGIFKKDAVGSTGMAIAKISDLLANVNKAQFSKLIAQAKRNAKYRYASFYESIKYTVARIKKNNL